LGYGSPLEEKFNPNPVPQSKRKIRDTPDDRRNQILPLIISFCLIWGSGAAFLLGYLRLPEK
jgi:hypothetical protein